MQQQVSSVSQKRDCEAFQHVLERYAFGDATQSEREEVELHMLDCDSCWRVLSRLSGSIHSLRTQPFQPSAFFTNYELFGLLGLSGRMSRNFGGHTTHVLFAAAVYASLYAISLLFEVAYQFDRYGLTATFLAVAAVFPWILITSVLSLRVLWKLAPDHRGKGFVISAGFFGLAALALIFGLWQYLPSNAITVSTTPAYPAQIAYIKDVMYYLPFGLVFIVLPFYSIVSMQAQLASRRHRAVLALINRENGFMTPASLLYPKVWQLAILLALIGMLSIHLTTNLFDHLQHGPFTRLFMVMIQSRTLLFFCLGAECLLWYSRALDILQRECLATLGTIPRGV